MRHDGRTVRHWHPYAEYDRICPDCNARVLVSPFTGIVEIKPCLTCEARRLKARAKKLLAAMAAKKDRRLDRHKYPELSK